MIQSNRYIIFDRSKKLAYLYKLLLQLWDVGLNQSYRFDTQNIFTLKMIIVYDDIYVDSLFENGFYTKDIHRYSFAMVKAEKSIPADIAGSFIT